MSKIRLFYKLILTNIKRLRYYIPQLVISVLILLAIFALLALGLTKTLFKDKSFNTINIAYYLPEDEDIKYNSMALGMMEDMESMTEVATLCRVPDIETGYSMLEGKEALFFIIVPERFFSGIMDSTNPRLTIAVLDYNNLSTYIANELLLAYARYLGIAQAGIYSGLDTIRENSDSPEDEKAVLNNTNIIYLERALNHEPYLKIENASDAGDYTLIEHYSASIIMLTLFFSGFIIMPWLNTRQKGLVTKLDVVGINPPLRFAASFISCLPAVYICFIPCFIAVCIYNKTFNALGIITVFPAVALITLLITLSYSFTRNSFAAGMVLFTLSLVIAYIGGGLLPTSFLPQIVKECSTFLPGEYIIKTIEHAIFI